MRRLLAWPRIDCGWKAPAAKAPATPTAMITTSRMRTMVRGRTRIYPIFPARRLLSPNRPAANVFLAAGSWRYRPALSRQRGEMREAGLAIGGEILRLPPCLDGGEQFADGGTRRHTKLSDVAAAQGKARRQAARRGLDQAARRRRR